MRRFAPFALLLPISLVIAGAANAHRSGTTVNLVAYSTPKPVMQKLIQRFGHQSAGQGVSFTQSYGPSGSQSRAIAAGQPADIAFLSTGLDIDTLVSAGLVAKSWTKTPYGGIAADSVVAFVVRPGNPKHIKTWNDMTKAGVQVVTPNPFTSGGARWNIMAAYGAQLKLGQSSSQAEQYLASLFKNVVVQPDSASDALQTFVGGKGDVLLDYESDAIAAQTAGDAIQYIVPKQTILIETPIAITSKSSHKSQAQAFVNWQWTTAGQTIWAEQGYRPVLKSVFQKFSSKFPTPPQMFTIDDLGGWTQVKKEFFDPSTGSITKIEQQAGVPTASS
jgi:sulfate/thiosulfate-binding protein